MKQIVAGIVAHVDAGKTTLSEALLYRTGEIRKLGRVDHGDAFLDTNSLEKARGITIFAHQALVEHGDLRLTLLDTPGHVDFAAETERVLRVLDYAILVVSGHGWRARPYRDTMASAGQIRCADVHLRQQVRRRRIRPRGHSGTVAQTPERCDISAAGNGAVH